MVVVEVILLYMFFIKCYIVIDSCCDIVNWVVLGLVFNCIGVNYSICINSYLWFNYVKIVSVRYFNFNYCSNVS